jgi:outer membrane immunogenic protein
MRLRQAVLALALCAFATPTFAQGVVVGVKGGVNFASLSFDPEDEDGAEAKSRTGFVGGLFVGIPVTPAISVQPEVLFVQAGTKLEGPEFGGESVAIKLNQVQIPVLLKANLGSGSARGFVVVGPVFGFKAGKIKFDAGDLEEFFDDEIIDEISDEIDENISSTDVAIAFGGGVNVGPLSIELRYNLGVKNNDTSDSDQSVKTRGFMVLAGFGF